MKKTKRYAELEDRREERNTCEEKKTPTTQIVSFL